MSKLMLKLWNDDAGALIAMEFLFIATLLFIGVMIGIVTVRNAVVTELYELAQAVMALSQGYTFDGLTGCCSEVQGSQTIDTPGTVAAPTCLANQIPSDVNVTAPCN
jgi:hypothetical protein